VVDGTEIDVREGASILRALGEVGIDVPSLCDDPRLAPYGECRMCLVRVGGAAQPVAACLTAVEHAMVIETAPRTSSRCAGV